MENRTTRDTERTRQQRERRRWTWKQRGFHIWGRISKHCAPHLVRPKYERQRDVPDNGGASAGRAAAEGERCRVASGCSHQRYQKAAPGFAIFAAGEAPKATNGWLKSPL
ncbi:hypothetical protein MTO96_001401 [Rhipicephalus appendiculatus]